MNRTGTARALMAASALSLAAATGVAAEPLRTITYLAETHFGVTEGMRPFMSCVTEATDSAVEFDFYPGGQLASAEASLDALSNGLADIAYIVPQRVASDMPLTNIPVLPNMGESAGEIVTAYRTALASGGLLAKELADNGLELLFLNQYPPYQIGFAEGRVDTLAGFDGQKIRVIGGSATSTATVLDAVPVELSAGDVYVAMQRGTIDAVLFPIAGMKAFKLNEVSKAISNNANFGGSMAMVAMSASAFQGLSEEHQAVLKDCAAEAEANLLKYQDGAQAEILAEFAAGGVDVYAFPEAELAAINTALEATAREFVDRLEARGLPGQAVYDEFTGALGR